MRDVKNFPDPPFQRFPKCFGIVVDEKTRFGKPLIKDTRVPIDLVIGKLAGGMTYEEIMTKYDLTREQILTALKD